MSIEGLPKTENLSEKQREMLDSFAESILPLVVQLKKTNDSNFSEQIIEETAQFKDTLEKEGISISDEQIDKVIQDVFNFQEAA